MAPESADSMASLGRNPRNLTAKTTGRKVGMYATSYGQFMNTFFEDNDGMSFSACSEAGEGLSHTNSCHEFARRVHE